MTDMKLEIEWARNPKFHLSLTHPPTHTHTQLSCLLIQHVLQISSVPEFVLVHTLSWINMAVRFEWVPQTLLVR